MPWALTWVFLILPACMTCRLGHIETLWYLLPPHKHVILSGLFIASI